MDREIKDRSVEKKVVIIFATATAVSSIDLDQDNHACSYRDNIRPETRKTSRPGEKVIFSQKNESPLFLTCRYSCDVFVTGSNRSISSKRNRT